MFEESKTTLIAMGDFFRQARKRRRWRQKDAAQRLGISVDTLARTERGESGIAIGVIVDLFYLYVRLEDFKKVIDPANDAIGLSQELERLPKRINLPKIDRDF